jgi:hypothetical protein
MNKGRFAMRHLGAGRAPVQRARTMVEFLLWNREAMESMHSTHCVVAGELARRLGLGEAVREPLLQVFERWDGKGDPGLLVGEAISRPVRLVQLADVVEVFYRAGGVGAAVAVAGERGTHSTLRWSTASVARLPSCRRRSRLQRVGTP